MDGLKGAQLESLSSARKASGKVGGGTRFQLLDLGTDWTWGDRKEVGTPRSEAPGGRGRGCKEYHLRAGSTPGTMGV